jgi:hypothetical protein
MACPRTTPHTTSPKNDIKKPQSQIYESIKRLNPKVLEEHAFCQGAQQERTEGDAGQQRQGRAYSESYQGPIKKKKARCWWLTPIILATQEDCSSQPAQANSSTKKDLVEWLNV